MKVFVWEYVNHLTWDYHDGGGLLVVAESLERAKEVAGVKEFPSDPPDFTFETTETEERYIVFGDSGCC